MRDKKDKPIPMLKLSVMDASGTLGTLSMWRPNEDLFHGLKEKSLVKVNNAMVVSIRDSIVHLKCTKQTRFKMINNKSADFAQDCDRYVNRVSGTGCARGAPHILPLFGSISFVLPPLSIISSNAET